MPTNNFPGIGYTTQGRDWNFFQKITVTASSYGGSSVSGEQPDIILPFTTQSILFLNEDSSSIISVSFNGTTQHDELNPILPSRSVVYDNRVISKIWFKLVSGSSAVVSVRAFATR